MDSLLNKISEVYKKHFEDFHFAHVAEHAFSSIDSCMFCIVCKKKKDIVLKFDTSRKAYSDVVLCDECANNFVREANAIKSDPERRVKFTVAEQNFNNEIREFDTELINITGYPSNKFRGGDSDQDFGPNFSAENLKKIVVPVFESSIQNIDLLSTPNQESIMKIAKEITTQEVHVIKMKAISDDFYQIFPSLSNNAIQDHILRLIKTIYSDAPDMPLNYNHSDIRKWIVKFDFEKKLDLATKFNIAICAIVKKKFGSDFGNLNQLDTLGALEKILATIERLGDTYTESLLIPSFNEIKDEILSSIKKIVSSEITKISDKFLERLSFEKLLKFDFNQKFEIEIIGESCSPKFEFHEFYEFREKTEQFYNCLMSPFYIKMI